MMKKILFALFSLGVLGLAFYNFKFNSDFLKAPLYTLINIVVAVVFAYYLTQRKTDERKLKETAASLIDKIQVSLCDERFYKITTQQDVDFLRLKQRTVSNQIDVLSGINKKLKFSEDKDMNYVCEKYTEYIELMGNHIKDIEYLQKSENDLFNKISLIDNKLDVIKFALYK